MSSGDHVNSCKERGMEKAADKSQLGGISNPTASEREREAEESSLTRFEGDREGHWLSGARKTGGEKARLGVLRVTGGARALIKGMGLSFEGWGVDWEDGTSASSLTSTHTESFREQRLDVDDEEASILAREVEEEEEDAITCEELSMMR